MSAASQSSFSEQVAADTASASAKQWRSDCLDHFAELEQQVGRLLKCLNETGSLLGKVKLGQQTRTSFEELRRQLTAKGHGKGERQKLNATLDPLETMLEWRAQIAHGVLDVWLGRNGKWLFTLRQADGACTGPVRWYAYPSSEAALLEKSLREQVAAFVQRSEQLCETLHKLPKA